tara:strand:- start:693 stop:908 length:216 start_codon:yes stop_codon:yes gene_type:complete
MEEEDCKTFDSFVDDIRSFINDKSIRNPQSHFDEIAPNKEVRELLELLNTIEDLKKRQGCPENTPEKKNHE